MPQIEIMQADLPHTLYLKDGHKDGKGARKNTVANDRVIQMQEEANRRMMERKAKQEREWQQEEDAPVTIEELFAKETK